MSMLVSLTAPPHEEEEGAPAEISAETVGGKAASLAKLYSIPELSEHVPNSFALTVKFFQPWLEALVKQYGDDDTNVMDESACVQLQQAVTTLPLDRNQKAALATLQQDAFPSFSLKMAAVRSSAPEEDGTEHSFAGAFVTKLGVTSATLEQAVRACFASRMDARVWHYLQQQSRDRQASTTTTATVRDFLKHASFAVVVMEMMDSIKAGVAFTANPLNSDRDELVVDASWGLGESVVDGSVTADRYLFDKVHQTVMERTIGTKTVEKRIHRTDGGVETKPIEDEAKQTASTLTDEQMEQLAKLAALVEETYGMPMDIEWAYIQESSGDTEHLKLLQARPITTLFYIDDNMMTAPGERRVLYYDYNVVSDATTTDPFTRMDMNFYGWASTAMMLGITDRDIFTEDPKMPIFKASTRQYANLSIFLKYMSTETCSTSAEVLDPYLASIFDSKDCNRNKYKVQKLPDGVGLLSTWRLLRQFPFWKLYKIGKECKKDPQKASQRYQELVQKDKERFRSLAERGANLEEGLQSYASELFKAMSASFEFELSVLFFVVLGLFKELDKQRREGKTEESREEYGALCSGYEGDELMEMNIEIYKLARLLPEAIWKEYQHKDLNKLAGRIEKALEEGCRDPELPAEFLKEWKSFMQRHGWDGQNQLFPSCPRYNDSPVLLLSKMQQNVGDHVTNPADIVSERVQKRREVMALQEDQARKKSRWFHPFALSKIQNRNACIEHLMWIRNAPKMHLSQLCGLLRAEVLKVEESLVKSGRLQRKGDIFHVDLNELDQALREPTMDLMTLVEPRKRIFERALRFNECPLLVDSRCRVLRPDPPDLGHVEEGILIGAAVSPGIAKGRVRIIRHPNEYFESGEILAATVTGPAWTPLFAGASGIVLQIGGALQHGALCAREYGKPAVSNIDVHLQLKTGMLVEVDGNRGIVKIIE